METFVQPKITGYRELSRAELDLINEGKALAEACGAYIAKLRKMNGQPDGDSSRDVLAEARGAYIAKLRKMNGQPDGDSSRDVLQLDQRWISIGATDLQRGFMAVIRGIAQPTTF